MRGKGNDGTGNVPERDNWETPQWLFDLLDSQYHFTIDMCASPHNAKCKEFIQKIQEVQELPEEHVAWMNPPFSKAREMFEHFFRLVKKGVAIYRCDNMETKVWQEVIFKNADWIFIPKGRIEYSYNLALRQGRGTRFPSALIGVGLPPVAGMDGQTLWIKKEVSRNGKMG